MGTVLIVDDSEDLRDLLTIIVARHGHTAVSAANIEQAAAHLTMTDIDAVLLDSCLDSHSGLRLCRNIRHNATADPIAIILVSGDASSDQVIAGLAAGADDYVTKPFRGADLIARLDAALARSAARRPSITAAQAARAAAQAAYAMCQTGDAQSTEHAA